MTAPNDSPGYDLILVGSGFASAFFLDEYLRLAGGDARVLVLERGQVRDHTWQLDHRGALEDEARRSFEDRSGGKPWIFRLAFGGASACWWACTPRMLPADFELRSRYGVGADWPIGYDELEPYYARAEAIMAVSGPSGETPTPRSGPYPQPPHRLSDPDLVLARHFPGRFFVQATARPRVALPSGRPPCCATGVCGLCPIDSKFTVLNEMRALFDDPRVSLVLGADVDRVEVAGSRATGVAWTRNGREERARGELIGLGANAIFNPYILLRSGLDGPQVGRGLNEQISINAVVDLDGLDNYQGTTSITGEGYMHYDGDHRRSRAAALIQTINVPSLRDERGRWRQRMTLKFIFEELRRDDNRVEVDPGALRPRVTFRGYSDYSLRGVDAVESMLPEVLAPLPVEDVRIAPEVNRTEAHILGTTVMGSDPATSVVDDALVHHRVRNLLVLGSGAFPTSPPANPTLTLCALALRSARRLLGSGAAG